jgi:hypothetical protein
VISQIGEHPEEDLVKFGYKLNVKCFQKIIKNRLLFLKNHFGYLLESFCRNMAILEIFLFKIWRIMDRCSAPLLLFMEG